MYTHTLSNQFFKGTITIIAMILQILQPFYWLHDRHQS